jgi:sugar phosphate isomerase/epimerase
MVATAGSANLGICLDLFHYYTGPSKYEDLGGLTPANLAWVQLSDLSGTPREFAGDGDRVLPGDGDFQSAAILEQLARVGYTGYVSLEVLNPHLWQVAADRVVGLGNQAMSRVAGRWLTGPAQRDGGS